VVPRLLLNQQLKRRIAIKAAKAMDLKVAGVDIIRSSKGPLLLK
jgi:ribosomal protein S6--L-glutamate ligase